MNPPGAWAAPTRLSGVANSLGTRREWLCMPTGMRWRAATGATRAVVAMFDDEVITGAPRVRAISNARSISASAKSSRMLTLYAAIAIPARWNASRTRANTSSDTVWRQRRSSGRGRPGGSTCPCQSSQLATPMALMASIVASSGRSRKLYVCTPKATPRYNESRLSTSPDGMPTCTLVMAAVDSSHWRRVNGRTVEHYKGGRRTDTSTSPPATVARATIPATAPRISPSCWGRSCASTWTPFPCERTAHR